MSDHLLPHSLERRVSIRAPRETVFRFFSDSERWARWWGAGSSIDPRPGGAVKIRYPNGVEAGGQVVEIDAPHRLAFTFGYANGTPMPLGASLVTISLVQRGVITEVVLAHRFSDTGARAAHVAGWRFQLSMFANVVSDEVHQAAHETIDEWFSAWAETDADARRARLSRIAIPDAQYRDRFAALESLDDIVEHIGAVHRFMPGTRIERTGALRHAQGIVLADWTSNGAGAQPASMGTTMFVLAPDGRIEWATGFWSA